jgi:hypothetical protein
MIRNLKVMGLALVAVFALSAVVASAAMAQQGKITSDGPVTLTGTETGAAGSGSNALKAFGLEVECTGSTYHGMKVLTNAQTLEGKKHELLPSGSSDVTLVPTYKPCIVVGLNWPATVTMNGCDYDLKIGATTVAPPTDNYGVTASLKCPAGKDVTLDIWTPGKDVVGNAPMCIIHFGEAGNQTRPGGDLRDTTNEVGGKNNDLDLTGTFTGISALKTKSTEDPLLCPEASTAVAELKVDATVKGDNSLGEPTGIGLSHL